MAGSESPKIKIEPGLEGAGPLDHIAAHQPSSQARADSPMPVVKQEKKEKKRKHRDDGHDPEHRQHKHKHKKTTDVEKPFVRETFLDAPRAPPPVVPPRGPPPPTPYHAITATMYLPLSPISISPTQALASLCSMHLSPLLLTYYPPFDGLVLAYSDVYMSEEPPASAQEAAAAAKSSGALKPLTMARSAGEYGDLFVYVTATYLVYRPETGQILEGKLAIQVEGFLGINTLNYFTVGVAPKRIPKDWRYVRPGDPDYEGTTSGGAFSSASSVVGTDAESEMEGQAIGSGSGNVGGDSNDRSISTGPDQVGLAIDRKIHPSLQIPEYYNDSFGYYVTSSGRRVGGILRFIVRDVDVIPGPAKDKGFIALEGSMLTPEDEAKRTAHERKKARHKARLAAKGLPYTKHRTSKKSLLSAAESADGAAALADGQPQGDAMDLDEPEPYIKPEPEPVPSIKREPEPLPYIKQEPVDDGRELIVEGTRIKREPGSSSWLPSQRPPVVRSTTEEEERRERKERAKKEKERERKASKQRRLVIPGLRPVRGPRVDYSSMLAELADQADLIRAREKAERARARAEKRKQTSSA
ncbi:hypothetical protein KEM52_004696 [Ascosphaera acerosa]|nr:hypothetical protein KEM52_004696 [Ascosphaera acerosa]